MNDEVFYQQVAEELREQRINEALWTKATAKAMGDENKVRAVYIQLRVQQLTHEHWAQRESADEAAAQAQTGPLWLQKIRQRAGPVPLEILKWVAIALLLFLILKIYRLR